MRSVRKDDRPNRDLGPVDVVTLLNTFRDMQQPIMFTIIHVLTTTGIRNEEFCTLQVKDLKVDSIQGGYYLDVLGKGNKRRHVPLKEKVVHSIRSFRQCTGPIANRTSATGRSAFYNEYRTSLFPLVFIAVCEKGNY